MKITTKLVNSMLGEQMTQEEMIAELNHVARLNGLTPEYVSNNYKKFIADVLNSMNEVIKETVEKLKR